MVFGFILNLNELIKNCQWFFQYTLNTVICFENTLPRAIIIKQSWRYKI